MPLSAKKLYSHSHVKETKVSSHKKNKNKIRLKLDRDFPLHNQALPYGQTAFGEMEDDELSLLFLVVEVLLGKHAKLNPFCWVCM